MLRIEDRAVDSAADAFQGVNAQEAPAVRGENAVDSVLVNLAPDHQQMNEFVQEGVFQGRTLRPIPGDLDTGCRHLFGDNPDSDGACGLPLFSERLLD
jgi:hypothetical protein